MIPNFVLLSLFGMLSRDSFRARMAVASMPEVTAGWETSMMKR